MSSMKSQIPNSEMKLSLIGLELSPGSILPCLELIPQDHQVLGQVTIEDQQVPPVSCKPKARLTCLK